MRKRSSDFFLLPLPVGEMAEAEDEPAAREAADVLLLDGAHVEAAAERAALRALDSLTPPAEASSWTRAESAINSH